MPHRFIVVCAGLLLLAGTIRAQADQAASAEKQQQQQAGEQQKNAPKKQSSADAIAALIGGPKLDKEAVERGRKIFVPTCGFCHGNKGDTIGPVIRNGRPERGMPAFAAMTNEQIEDISTFLHSLAQAVTNRFAYQIGDVITGDATKGAAFFNGDGHCSNCHQPAGDLAHVATKYEAVELQRRMLYPAPNVLDMFLGRPTAPVAPSKVTVKVASGEQVTGTLIHLDEFTVTMHDASGAYRSFSRDKATVEVQDPRAQHEALLPLYTDEEMHNVLAYLETLK
jgi:cytochrome c oxidase cbb3-type subunit III